MGNNTTKAQHCSILDLGTHYEFCCWEHNFKNLQLFEMHLFKKSWWQRMNVSECYCTISYLHSPWKHSSCSCFGLQSCIEYICISFTNYNRIPMLLNSLWWRTCFLHAITWLCRCLAWRFTLSNFTFAIMRSTAELVALGMLFVDGEMQFWGTVWLVLWINQIILIC